MLDDVYDEKVYIEDHELYTLKKGNVLQYMALMECVGFCPSYIPIDEYDPNVNPG